jgi:hypothetical protein
MISFDRSSDRMIDHLVPILSGTPYQIRYRTTEMSDFKTLGPAIQTWNEEELDVEDMIGEEKAIYSSLSGAVDPSKAPVSPHLLRPEEVDAIDDMEEQVSRGDLVLSFLDIASREKAMMAAYFSTLVIAKEAFSLCMLSSNKAFKDFKQLEKLNREFLDLSMSFHGLVGLSKKDLDQADLLSTSKGGSALIMTWGAARPGGNPAATSTKDALSNPLCDIDLSTVRKALVNVTGPSDLALEDSLVASEVLRKRTRDNARIIWGVNILQDLSDDMEVFIILSTTPMELLVHWYSWQDL